MRGQGYCQFCHQAQAALLHAADWVLLKLSPMNTFKVLKTFSHGGRDYLPSETVQLPHLVATQCQALGLVEPLEKQADLAAAATAAGQKAPAKKAKP